MESMTTGQELSLREIQAGALNILKRIDAICQEKGLRYWVAYGTLIGAVRHRGFIPWDDDLDIMMPRPDYERLLLHFKHNAESEKPIVILAPELGKNMPFLISRVSDTRFQMQGEYGDLIKGLGTFVDVYPLDGMGDDYSGAMRREAEAFSYVRRYVQALNPQTNSSTAGPIKELAKAAHAIILGNPKKYQQKIIDLCARDNYDKSKYVAVATWPSSDDTTVYSHEAFENTVRLPFEDMTVPVPSNYDEVLKADYGNYMQLPPLEMQRPHKIYSIYRIESDH